MPGEEQTPSPLTGIEPQFLVFSAYRVHYFGQYKQGQHLHLLLLQVTQNTEDINTVKVSYDNRNFIIYE
jgi:hypothetical protein